MSGLVTEKDIVMSPVAQELAGLAWGGFPGAEAAFIDYCEERGLYGGRRLAADMLAHWSRWRWVYGRELRRIARDSPPAPDTKRAGD